MKPKVLYHGSPNIDIDVLEPREESPGHAVPGKYVFASQHKELAAMFLAPKVAPMQISQFGEEYILIANCTEQAYKNADKGGTIYALPAATFQKGATDMPDVEWFSSKPVRSSNKETYTSSLDAMHKCNVRVYFVDDATYTAVQTADDYGWGILQSLS